MNFEIPNHTKAILLDLGGVLLQLDLQKTFDAFAQLGFQHFEKQFDSYSGSPFIEDFEEGKISNEMFITEVKKRCSPNTSTTAILDAWNAMLGDFPVPIFELLQQLKKDYKLFLYSNTNALHVAYLNQYYQHRFGESGIAMLFDKIYYSHILGIRKPHKEGYIQIMEEQHVQPNELFYIDDGSMHIATAKSLGIQSLLWKQNAPLTDASI
jgi:glucose-1-phosphatase